MNDPILFLALLTFLAALGCGLAVYFHGPTWKRLGLLTLSLLCFLATVALGVTGIR